MKTIQKWFEQLAGVSQDELERIALASKVFAEQGIPDISELKTPACWRRSCRIRATKN